MRLLALLGFFFLLACIVTAAPIVQDTGNISVSTGQGSDLSVTFTGGSYGLGGGGGGGGGGGDSGNSTCLVQGATMSHIYDQLDPNGTYVIKTTTDFFITNLTFRVTEEIPDGATFTVTRVTNLACEQTPPIASTFISLGYERVDYNGLAPSQIMPNVTINLTVPVMNITGANATPSAVMLLRYDGQNWAQLPLTLVTTDSLAAYYSARSPGLSVFAVAVPAPTPPPVPSTGTPSANATGNGAGGPVTGGATVTTQAGGGGVGGQGGGGLVGGGAAGQGAIAVTPGRKSSLPLLSVIIVLVLGGALGLYYYLDNRQKVATVNANVEARQPGKPVEALFGFASIGNDAFQDPVEELKVYVDKELRQGYHREQIASQLRMAGWPETVVVRVLDELTPRYLASRGMHEPHQDYGRVQAFLEEKLAHGYDVTVIKAGLVKVGWDAALIDSLLRDLQQDRAAATAAYSAEALAKLRAFVMAELQSGHSKARVREALLGAGWQARAVDAELVKH